MKSELFKIIRDKHFTNIIDLVFYCRDAGRMDLVAYIHNASSTIHSAIVNERRKNHKAVTSLD